MQHRERKDAYLVEDYSSSEEEDKHYRQDKKMENRRLRRFRRRASRGDMNIFAARKRILLDTKKTALQKENAKRIAKLGPGGCPACMSKPCNYAPVVSVQVSDW